MNETESTNIGTSYLNALTSGDATKASEAISSALSRGLSPSKVYLKVLLPALTQVEELWLSGKLSVAEEHLATQIALQEMTRVRQLIKPKARLGKRALVATIDGDAHYLGGRLVADFLYMDGWEVDFLGTNTPSDDLIKFVTERRVDLVCLSATTESNLPELGRVIREIKKASLPPKVIVGGPVVGKIEESKLSALDADGVAIDAQVCTSIARKVCGLAEAETTLNQYLKGLGERILEKRKARHYTQQELAGLANLDRAYISSVEHGKQNMTVGAVFKLATALEVPLEDLLVGGQG